jgi:Tol biopolymer transport system component
MAKTNLTFFSAIIFFPLLILLLTPVETFGQYFGRNKVRYTDVEFKTLHSEHFEIYFYEEEKGGIEYAAEMAERWYARHSNFFDDTLMGKQPLILYGSFPQFAQTNVTQGMIGQGTGGFTEPLLRRIAMPFAGPLKETDHVLGHELVHAFQYDLTGRGGRSNENPNSPSLERLPLWFVEGMAEYLTIGPNDPFTSMWIREAAIGELPEISDLTDPRFFPYRFGMALLSYIGARWGDKKVATLLRSAASYGNVNTAIDSVLGISTDSLSKDWHKAIHAQYDSLFKITKRPIDYGRVLIKSNDEESSLNVSPVISPDGKNIVFFSSRNLFSIDIFLADAETGKIKRTVLNTVLNTHLQSLEFINSAGAWDPESKRFLFSAVEKGRPILSILNIETGNIEREFRFPNIGEIFDPAWSPDKRYIVFSGLSNGLSNLFLYDLTKDTLNNLTNDPYAELQPSWSPDGKTIAFVTDRFSTKLSNLDIGEYQLAIMDFNSRKIEKIAGFDSSKSINPQWTPDGKGIYFLSDKNGITNLYKLDISTSAISQITNLYGGISGITAISPALSSARKVNKVVFSAYEKGRYNIYSIDSEAILEGKTPIAEYTSIQPGTLPTTERKDNVLSSSLNNPDVGFPSDTSFKITGYDASLSLVGATQAAVVGGADRFGAYLGGGISLIWSDLLGDHNLITGLQIQSIGTFRFTDLAALVGYFNTKHRWNYGGIIQQIPYNLYYYNAGFGSVNGRSAYIEQQVLSRQTDRSITGILSYPFSDFMRVEFIGGFRNITFLNEIQTTAIASNGEILLDETQELKSGSALNLGNLGSALVFDNSFYGATGPLLGQRYRFEVSPTFGSLTWIDLLGDFREYFMPITPFTLAGRILHYGRYGKSSEDSRLQPLYIGWPGLVRGYESGSFSSEEVSTDTSFYSELFDRLTGSKMLLANFEIRFPLLGALGIGSGFYGFLPLDFGVFFDAGTAWYNDQKPKFFGGNKKIVTSAGLLARLNLFGFAIIEVDYVHPFDRPDREWMWQFTFTEGF